MLELLPPNQPCSHALQTHLLTSVGVYRLFSLLSSPSPNGRWLSPHFSLGYGVRFGTIRVCTERPPGGGFVSSNFRSKSTFRGAGIPIFYQLHKILGERQSKRKANNSLRTQWCQEGKLKPWALQGCNLHLEGGTLPTRPSSPVWCMRYGIQGCSRNTAPGETLSGILGSI